MCNLKVSVLSWISFHRTLKISIYLSYLSKYLGRGALELGATLLQEKSIRIKGNFIDTDNSNPPATLCNTFLLFSIQYDLIKVKEIEIENKKTWRYLSS